jgi:hypothetical protein
MGLGDPTSANRDPYFPQCIHRTKASEGTNFGEIPLKWHFVRKSRYRHAHVRMLAQRLKCVSAENCKTDGIPLITELNFIRMFGQ